MEGALNLIWLKLTERFSDASHSKDPTSQRYDNCTTDKQCMSLRFQLPSLFKCQKFVVMVSPTLSLINSRIEELKKLQIDAITLGRAAAEAAQLNHDRIFSSDGTNPLPSIVFMTPEHFVNHVSYHLERIKANCQIVGVGRGAQDV